MHIYGDLKFHLLCQEAHLAKNALLSGFDLLLQANLDQDKDGYIYSGLFNLTIGAERLMKLIVVCDFMLKNDYGPPPRDLLQKKFNHDLNSYMQRP